MKKDLEEFKRVKSKAYSFNLIPQVVCESCRHEPRHGDFSYENQALFFAALKFPIEKHLEELIAEVEGLRISMREQRVSSQMNFMDVRDKLQKAEKVLRFYADLKNHEEKKPRYLPKEESIIWNDEGRRAREYFKTYPS